MVIAMIQAVCFEGVANALLEGLQPVDATDAS
jgi:hypothetical protein